MAKLTKEQSKFSTQKILKDKWRWAAFFVVYMFSSLSGLFLPGWFDAPMDISGSNPPWYFIREDFFQAIGFLVGVVVMLAILAATWKRHSFENWLLLGFVSLWLVSGIVPGIVIYLRCDHFFDYAHAVSAWPTFDAYLHSYSRYTGLPLGAGLMVLCGRRFSQEINGMTAEELK